MSGARFGGTFFVEGYDKYGRKKWEDVAHNTVVNVGLQHILDVTFCAADTVVSPWYMGLLADTVVTADRTGANIAKATEISNASLPAYVEARTAQTLSNTLNKSTFTIDKDGTTIEGAYLVSTNGITSVAGILMCAAPFAGGTKVGDSGDKVIVTYTFVASDDTSS